MKTRLNLLFLLLGLLFVVVGCTGSLSGGVVPIYRGMTVSSQLTELTSYGTLDIDNPDFIDPIFEEDIQNAFGNLTQNMVDYYAPPQSTLYITINVLNPDQYEILSFTLNGNKYQSYQFEDGSDSENLILSIQIGETSGVIEYTIDSIKYIDGTAINDVRMEGDQTVSVGVEQTNLPFSTISNVVLGSSSIAFDVKITDYAELITASEKPAKVFLFDGLAIIDEQDLPIEVNSIVFDQLEPGTTYQYAVAAAYDKTDTLGMQVVILDFQTFSTYEMINIGNIQSTQNSISFTLDIIDENAVGAVTSIDLYLNDQLIGSKLVTDTYTFSDLLSDITYELRLTYTYDLDDGNGEQIKYQIKEIKTLSKQLPMIEYGNLNIAQEAIVFDSTYTDIDQVGAFSSIDLYKDNQLVKSITDLTSLTGLSFDELLSDNDYQIRTTVAYDLNDGVGVQTINYTEDIHTASKTIPVLSFDEIVGAIDRVSFTYSVDDIDQTGSISDISIYKNSVKEQTLSNLEDLYFSGLIADTQYQVKIQYQYNLNDGNGAQTLEVSRSIYTAPYLGIISTDVINTERLTEGDTVYLEVQIDNPSNVTFTNVIINGNTYPVSDVTTQSFIRVEFLIDDSYTGGITSFVIEKIQGFNHSEERAFDVSDNNIGYAFVNGDISVLGVNILDEDGNALDQAMPGDVFYISIDFDNPTGYEIDQIDLTYLGVLESSQFTQNDSHTHVMIKQTSYYRNTIVEYNINSFTYSDENIGSKTKNVDGFGDFIVCVTNSSYEYIYNATDLNNMRDGYAYKLANDIDLSGVEWTPKDINFIVLDGNGYSISNLRIVKTYLDTHVRIGLFKSINYSSIKNLTVDNVLIMIDLQRESTSADYQSYGGLIAGNAYMTNFTNVNAYGEMSINNEVGNYNCLGGIVGEAYRSNFDRVYTNVILSGDNTVGGLLGRANEVQVIKSHTSGTIYGDRDLGGLFGNAYNTKITNSYSTMDIHVEESVAGGLVGSGSSIYIKDSYYEGTIYQTQPWFEAAGLFVYGDNSTVINSFSIAVDGDGNALNSIYSYWNNITVVNSYALLGNELFGTATAEQMITTMADIWDLSIWGFNGGSPVLKWTPSIRIVNVLQGETFLTFDIATTDFDEVGVIDKIELFKGTELIDSLSDVSLRRFEGLRYNTGYTIKVTYKYSYGDEIGDQYIITSQNVKTLPVTGTPEIDFSEVAHSFDSLSFGYTLTDDQNIGEFVSIEIYDESNSLISTLLETDEFIFTDLESDQLYKIIITYSYDLDDGYGIQYVTSINYMRTNPYVDVTGTHVLNTDALFIGDILVLQIDIDNPDNVLFTEVVINGNVYLVATSSLTRVRIDIDVDNQFIYGDVNLVIDSLKGNFMGEIYTYDLAENNSCQVYINGEINVTSIDVYNMDGEEIDYLENGESFYVDIHFYNPTVYDIESIDLNLSQYEWDTYNTQTITNFELNEAHTIARVQLTANQSMYQNISISGFQYSSEQLEALDKTVSGMKSGFVIVSDDTVKEIWTANDLKNMTSGYAYKLMADIDLTGVSWIPIESFNGVFDGNGNVISNLSIVRSYTDENAYVGLFGIIEYSVIKNLNLAGVSMVVTTKSSSTNNFEPNVGALAGRIYNQTTLTNIAISGDIDTVNQTNGQSFTGLLAGYIDRANLDKICVSGTINANTYAGGIAGFLTGTSISNSYANLTLTTESSQNGIFAGYGDRVHIQNSYSRGTLINSNNSWGNGGFIGTIYSSIIENVVSFTMDQNQNYIDPIQNAWSNTIENSFALSYSSYFTQTNFENAIDQIKLAWDLSIWGFSQDYPTLKRIPNVVITNVEPLIDGVSFEITTSDFDEVGEIASIELYQNDVLIEALSDLSLRTFGGLRYSSNYTIIVVYAYDYDDGSGMLTTVASLKFKTLDRENVPEVEFSDVVAGYDSVTFDYTIIDTLGIGELQSIELYDENGVLIQTLDGSELSFEELYTDTTYYIRVNYVYDFDDGWGENVLEAEYEFSTLALVAPQIEIIDQTSTINSIGFDIDVEDELLLGAITKVELFSDYQFVKELATFESLVFNDLLSGHYYIVKVTYTYDLNDQNGVQNTSAYASIYTDNMQQPYYWLDSVQSTTHSIGFTFNSQDPYEIGEVIKVSLYDGINKVETLTDLTQLEFTGLYSNHPYSIKITYTFDLNDGYGLRESVSQHYVQTNQYINPNVDFSGLEITQNSIYYLGKLYDSENLGEIINIALYQEDTLICEATDGIIDYNLLEPDVSYILIVDYQYDLNDKQGLQVEQAITNFQTAPYAGATQTDILNTGSVTIGDTLSMSIFLDNPSEVIFTKVVINGEMYSVSSYTVGKIRVDIDVTEDVGSGDTELVVTQLIGTYNDQTYTYELTTNNTVDVFINGDIYVESVSILDINGEAIETALKNESVLVGIELYNPTQYDISSVKLYVQGYGEITYYDNQFSMNLDHSFITVEVTTGTDTIFAVSLVEYTFDNDNIEPKTKQSSMSGSVILLNSAEPIAITTAQQLQNMQSGYRYRLDCDLDMSSVVWSPIDSFSGELDGNGHTISNLTIIGTYTDVSVDVGLFKSLRYAVVKDLNLVQVSYIITIKTDTNNGYSGRVGGLSGYTQYSSITNVMVSGDISLDNRSNGEASVGLIAGYSYDSTFDKVYTNGNLSSSQYVGGLVGRADHLQITDSYASTSFTSTKNNYAGGLIGYGYYIEIKDSYATGRNYQSWSYGGLAGQLGYSSLTNVFSYVKNINNENIQSVYSMWEMICKDAYSPVYDGYSQVKTLPEMLAIMNQKWNLDIWGFNGELPALKRVPTVSIVDIVSSEYGFEFGVETTDYDHVGGIISIELYQDDVLLQTLSDLSIRSFDGLRYGSSYTLIVKYQYSYGDEAGDTLIVISKRIRTLDKENVPIVEVVDVVETKDSVTFDYNITDTLGIGNDVVIKLYDAQYNLIETLEGSTLTFENLLSNYNYVIQVNYTYDFDDGFGTNTAEGIYTFKTSSKVTPTLVFDNVSSTDQKIQFGFIETDPDETGAIASISLYQDDVLIDSLSELSLRTFEGLDAYTAYRIVVTYIYDLNDTLGTHEITKIYNIKTSPIISATSTILMNTEAIIVGDTVVLKLLLNNPSEIIFTDAMVNGKVYGVNQTDINTLVIEILTDDAFIGGLTSLEVTNLYGSLGVDQFNVSLTENNVTEAFINGDIYVTDVNAEVGGQPIDYLTYYGDFQLVVDLFNPTGYDIEAITIYTENYGEQIYTGTQLVPNGDNTSVSIDLNANSSNYYYSIQVNKFTYSNETMSSRDRAASNKYTSFVLISDADIIPITTAAELQAMTSGQSYQLMNDIDLSGINWIPIQDFRGYFDGNGYTISNLNITKTYEDVTPYVGLFAKTNGAVIKNLNMNNVNLIISIRSYTDNGYSIFIGGLIGYIDSYTRVINVNVQGNLSATNPTSGSIYMGGIVGYTGQTTKLEDVNSDVVITASSTNSTYLGGITGYLGNRSEISNAYSKSTLIGNDYIGGIVGGMNQSKIHKVHTNTNIQGGSYIGGIVGEMWDSFIENAFSNGNITETNNYVGGITGMMRYSTIKNVYSNISFDTENTWSVGGVVGYVSSSNIITGSYSTCKDNNNQYIKSIGSGESQNQIDSYTLYHDGYSTVLTLEEIHTLIQSIWDSTIWDFTNTDEFDNPLFQ